MREYKGEEVEGSYVCGIFQLGSEHKQKEVGELLAKNNIVVVDGQESWEREDTRIEVEGYKWFGKPCNNQTSPIGEREGLAS